jgi:tetratricopeptide (TPR) repeat protein
MTLRAPFQLRRRTQAVPAVAILLPTRDPGDLFRLCARWRLDPSGRIFAVADGFLLNLERPTTDPAPGEIRLRELACGLYIPADAELVPALLDDEATGLVRDRGLVILPGGRAVSFDRRAAVALGELLHARRRRRRVWTALPQPPRLPERIDQIVLELPEQPPESLYRSLKEQVQRPRSAQNGSEDREDPARRGDAGQTAGTEQTDSDAAPGAQAGDFDPAAAAGKGSPAATGRFIPAVGAMLHSVTAFFGTSRQAVSRLKEKFEWEWTDNSALIRKLVREFREGDEAQALRRAIPFTRPDQRTVPVRVRQLPWSRALYNLADLLRRPARGETVPVGHAREDVTRELAQEYRKAAQRAVQQGDFRRAAYIYGLLLCDDRMAANALLRGGLHRDAAMLYLKRLNDRSAAAGAFEAAGQFDQALALYRELRQHETAGDLLRRIGEEAAAIEEYRRAAEHEATSEPPRYLHAGHLMEEKAGRPELALQYFRMGWDQRPSASASLCALELARFHAHRGAIEPIRTLCDEADQYHESFGSDRDAGFFYDTMLSLAGLAPMKPFVAELRDRSVLALARRLRRGIDAGRPAAPLVSTLFGRSKDWLAAVASDADFAATEALRRSLAARHHADRDPSIHGFQIGRGFVTATACATASGEIFIGFDTGLVLAYRAEQSQVVKVAEDIHPITALAVDPEGQTAVALRQSSRGTALSRALKRPDGSFRLRPDTYYPTSKGRAPAHAPAHTTFSGPGAPAPGPSTCWLTPVLLWGLERLVGLGQGDELLIIDASSGLIWRGLSLPHDESGPPTTAILIATGPPLRNSESRLYVVTHTGPRWVLLDLDGRILCQTTSPRWLHGEPGFDSVQSAPVTWRYVPPFLEVLGLDKNAAVYAAQLYLEDESIELLTERSAATDGGILAAARCTTNKVVAVGRSQIEWLGYGADRFHVADKLKLGLPTAVACFASHATQETVVVCADGFIAHVAHPAPPRRFRTARNKA